QGGRLLCASRCLGDSTHSRPQETAAGRNLITVFSTVNNPREIFFRVGAATEPARLPCRSGDDAPRTAPAQRAAVAPRQSCCKKTPCFMRFVSNAPGAARPRHVACDRGARLRRECARTCSGGSETGRRHPTPIARRNTPIAPICAKKTGHP